MRKKNPFLEEEIITVSMRLLAEKGIGAFSLRLLASELGISLGNLYTYYSSKELILITILQRKSDDLIGKVAEIESSSVGEYVRKLSCIFSMMYSHETGPLMSELGRRDEEAISRMNSVLSSIDRTVSDALSKLGITDDTLFKAGFVRRSILSALRNGIDLDKTSELIIKAII